jgi:hypothetical protein
VTLSEFKAWFEGFTDNIDGAPTPEQWAKVKEKVALLSSPALFHDPRPVPFGQWAERLVYPPPVQIGPNTASPLPQNPIVTC